MISSFLNKVINIGVDIHHTLSSSGQIEELLELSIASNDLASWKQTGPSELNSRISPAKSTTRRMGPGPTKLLKGETLWMNCSISTINQSLVTAYVPLLYLLEALQSDLSNRPCPCPVCTVCTALTGCDMKGLMFMDLVAFHTLEYNYLTLKHFRLHWWHHPQGNK